MGEEGMNNYQTEIQKLDDLANKLDDLKQNVVERQENKTIEGHPPLWSGEIYDLENFSNELQEWLDEPKLKEVKDITREFQGICNDKRKFQFDDNKSYYISILDILIRGKDVLDNINNDDIKKEGTRAILDQIFQQNDEDDLKIEVNKIEEFWREINDKIIGFNTENDVFIVKVKSDTTQNLIKSLKTGFNSDEISNEHLKIEKAKNSRELVKEIGSNAFFSDYDKNKDIDRIWNISDEIRKKLDSTNVDIGSITEYTERMIFSELLKHIKSRNDALKESKLTKIKERMDDVSEKLTTWSEKINRSIDDDMTRLDSWLSAIENITTKPEKIQEMIVNISGLKQSFNSLKFDNVKDLKTKELYDTFEEYYKLIKDIEDSFKTLLSENARKILDNLTKLKKIRDDLGDNFWEAVKELCDTFPQLKIKMEWGRVE